MLGTTLRSPGKVFRLFTRAQMGSAENAREQDTGSGIAETDLPKIFQPFFYRQEEKRNGARTPHLPTNRQESRWSDRSRKPVRPGHLFQNPLAPGAQHVAVNSLLTKLIRSSPII